MLLSPQTSTATTAKPAAPAVSAPTVPSTPPKPLTPPKTKAPPAKLKGGGPPGGGDHLMMTPTGFLVVNSGMTPIPIQLTKMRMMMTTKGMVTTLTVIHQVVVITPLEIFSSSFLRRQRKPRQK
jgi:hypothetical protein